MMKEKTIKQLYIRKGNLESNKNILIIGEESYLGGRDKAYATKGTIREKFLSKKDPYSYSTGLSYIHACPNIPLNSKNYTSDYDVHKYLKKYCKDLIIWDGESSQGITNSREAFIVRNKNVNKTVNILRKRIIDLVRPETFFKKIETYFVTNSLNKKHSKKQKKAKIKVSFWLVVIFVIFLFIVFPDLRNAF